MEKKKKKKKTVIYIHDLFDKIFNTIIDDFLLNKKSHSDPNKIRIKKKKSESHSNIFKFRNHFQNVFRFLINLYLMEVMYDHDKCKLSLPLSIYTYLKYSQISFFLSRMLSVSVIT